VWYNVLKILPFIWMLVIGIVVLTRKPAEALAKTIIAPTDSFNAQMLINTLCSVLLMSILLTIIAPRIGAREVSMDTFTEFFYRRPRNLTIAFAVEVVVAQPIARAVMQQYHLKTDRK
jgi:hypothetical protein